TSAQDHREAASAAPTDERRSLIQLAKEAFPHFERHVRRFRFLRRLLLYGGLLVLLVTAQTSWDVGHGRDVLGRIAQAQKDWDALLQTNPALADPGLCQAYQRGQTNPATDQHAQNQPPPDQHAQNQPPPDQHGQPQPAAGQHVQNQPGGTQGSAAATTTVDPNWLACARLGDIQTSREQAYSDLDQIFRCRGASCNAYLHVLHWAFLLCSGSEPQTISSGEPAPTTEPPVPSTPGAANTASSTGTGSESSPASANAPTPGKAAQQQQPATHIYWQSAISVLNVFTSYVLPLLYGLLGTIIGAFRSIQSKIRSSELAPRDFGLTIVGAFLGMAGGLVIGILFSPTSAPAPGNGNPLGNITLTAAALAFLAGYASQSFFGFIDDVIKKIFPADVAMSSPPPVAGSR
ncbi:MAG: hypothetical protein JO008_16340, partial [Alphaproteobacteria bacterium]|nr:hypothetical protein [Alphaproteobacteria bacterium]